MTTYMPLIIDLQKDKQTNKQYGIEHINRLLEDELKHLRSLKNQDNHGSFPSLKTNREVEGLKDYKKRALKGNERDCQSNENNRRYADCKMHVGPFSEFRQDYYREGRVTGKGEVPFFKVNQDKSSVSYRLPRLTGHQVNPEFAKSYVQTVGTSQSRRSDRPKRSSGKIVRSSGKLLKTDSIASESEDDINGSLRVCYCPLTARQQVDEKDDIKQKTLPSDKSSTSKTFHLACTRSQWHCQPITSEDRENSFCAGSVHIHTRKSQKQSTETKKTRHNEKEKTFLPEIRKDSKPKTKDAKMENVCERCRKRLEQAQKKNVQIETPQRKRNFYAEKKSRQVIKERTDAQKSHNDANQTHKTRQEATKTTQEAEHQIPESTNKAQGNPHQTQSVALHAQQDVGVFECAAYVHEDGTLSLLPGAFILRNNDYNVWSRNGNTRSLLKADVSNTSNLPRLV